MQLLTMFAMATRADLKSTARAINGLARRLGPGLITGAADDDPSGIATYSQAGSQFRFGLVWTLLLTTPLMIGMHRLGDGRRPGRQYREGLPALAHDAAGRTARGGQHHQHCRRHPGHGRS